MYYLKGTNYWECISTPSAEVVAAYPSGTIEVAKRPSEDYDYTDGAWVKNTTREQARLYAELRMERNTRLQYDVDPIVSNALRWDELSSSKKTEWQTYRSELLDLPANTPDPSNITWPTKPS
tara:strand:- start:16195 stop:16560 length:366 start_codon:yes stop_codon:yes gene_type:complete